MSTFLLETQSVKGTEEKQSILFIIYVTPYVKYMYTFECVHWKTRVGDKTHGANWKVVIIFHK